MWNQRRQGAMPPIQLKPSESFPNQSQTRILLKPCLVLFQRRHTETTNTVTPCGMTGFYTVQTQPEKFTTQYNSGRASALAVCICFRSKEKDGDLFVPNILHHICCSIMRYLQTNGMPQIDIFKDSGFSQFRMVLDAEMKRLQSAGIGAVHRKAEPITFEEEEILWQKGILGDHT